MIPFGAMNSLINQFQDSAIGRGPSAAEEMVRTQGNRQAAQTTGLARSARGGQSQALAMRNAVRANAMRQAETNANMAAVRAQEQMGARQALAPLLQQNTAATLAGISGGIDTVNAAKGGLGGWAGGLASAGLPLLLSDERRKRISSRGDQARTQVQEFLASLVPTEFTYDDEPEGTAPRTGVTAQDVSNSEAGRRMVVNTPGGAAIDPVSATGGILAALGELRRQIDEVRQGAGGSTMDRAERVRASAQNSPAVRAAGLASGVGTSVEPGDRGRRRVDLPAPRTETERAEAISRESAAPARALESAEAIREATRQATRRLLESRGAGRAAILSSPMGPVVGPTAVRRQATERPNPRGRTPNSFRSAPRRGY